MNKLEIPPAFISALLKKDNKRTEVDRFDIANFFGSAGFYHSKLLQSISSFATIDICKNDLIIYAQREMAGLQYWFLLQGEVRLYSSKKAHFQFIKSGSIMQTTRDSLTELGKFECTLQQGDFFGVESFLSSNPHAERLHSALVTKDGTIILPIQGATPIRHALTFIPFPHQYQVHTLSHWCKIAPELRSDHEVTLILHHLKGFPFFSRLPDHLGLSWAKMCVLVNVRTQTLLFRQNDPSDSIYFIIDGSCQVRIKKSNEDVKTGVGCGIINLLTLEADFGECVHTFESGESFGELSLDHAKPNQIPRRTASIICVQDCVLLRVDAEAYYTLQKLGQMSRIILSQWTKPFQVVAGSRSSNMVEMLSIIMLDFKYFSFMNESARRFLAQNMTLIDTQPGDIIFIEGEPVFNESIVTFSDDESTICQPIAPNIPRTWTTDSVFAVLRGSVGAFKKKKSTESTFLGLESYLHLKSTRKIETISDTFGQLQTTIVPGEGFGEELLHRKSSEVKRNFSYICLEPCQLLFYGRETFTATLGPSYDLGSGKTKMLMKKPPEQRTHRDLCIVFRELASLPFIQNFVEQDFHDFFSHAKFGTFPAYSVISNMFPKHCFGIVLSGAISVHQSDEEPGLNDVNNVKDSQCHAIRLMFGACKHMVKEGDIFGEHNLKSFSECTKMASNNIPSRCTYISRMPIDIIYWDVVALSPKLLAESQKGVWSPNRVIQIMDKALNQRTDDDLAVIDQFLRSFNFFSQYPDLSRIVSSPAFCLLVLDASDLIFKEADVVSHLYILLQGSIQISSKLKPEPEVFSGLSIFGNVSVDQFHSIGSRLMTCKAVEKNTHILQIPFEAFMQLEKLKMIAIYRGAKSFLTEHHCFKMLTNKSSLIDELISGCHILCKSKNDPCYLEGHFYERSIWAVLKGSVELVFNTESEAKNTDDSVLDVKISAVRSTSSSAKAAFSKQSTIRHSLGLLREGAAFAPFAVTNGSKKSSRLSADHDAVAAENDTVIVVFFMKHAEDESMAALCMVEQEVAFLSQWRKVRKIAGDHAIAQSLSSSMSLPKSALKTPKSAQRYRAVRPKTGLEGRIDPGLILPKLAGSRSVDSMHNNDILDVNNEGHFSVLSEACLEDLVSKLLRQTEDDAYSNMEVSKSCPSPPEVQKSGEGQVFKVHPESDPAECNPDVEKKILNIFAVDKFKRKAAMPSAISSETSINVCASADDTREWHNVNFAPSESMLLTSSSLDTQANDRGTPIRDTADEVFADNQNVASKIAAIMSGNKFKHNASQSRMESSIIETLEVARQNAAVAEQSWKGKVIEILKTDVFQRTTEDPENVLEHALSVAAQLAQQERESRLPKETVLIDTFCKRVREQLLLGVAVDSLAFQQLDIYVPEKPVRSFGRNRISDTARKLVSQDTQTNFGADQKVSDVFHIHRPHQAASSLLNLRNRHKQQESVDSRSASFPECHEQFHQHENRSLSVTKILTNNFLPTKLTGLPLARGSTPVFQHDTLESDIAGRHSASLSADSRLQPNQHMASMQPSFDQLTSDLSEDSHFTHHHNDQPALNCETSQASKQVGQVTSDMSTNKCILHDYLREVALNPKMKTQTRKLNSNISATTSSKLESRSHIPNTRMSNKIFDSKHQLHLFGKTKAIFSVTELDSISRWQNEQASHSIRTSQYKPIPIHAESIISSPSDCSKNRYQSFSSCRQRTLQDSTHGCGADLRLTLFPHSLEPRSPISSLIVGKGSTSKPKSRGYSSHGTGLTFDTLTFPPVNVVLNQNSPSSSKPQTPHSKPWSPIDVRSPSCPVSTKRSTGHQPHITGIALDDGCFFDNFDAP